MYKLRKNYSTTCIAAIVLIPTCKHVEFKWWIFQKLWNSEEQGGGPAQVTTAMQPPVSPIPPQVTPCSMFRCFFGRGCVEVVIALMLPLLGRRHARQSALWLRRGLAGLESNLDGDLGQSRLSEENWKLGVLSEVGGVVLVSSGVFPS